MSRPRTSRDCSPNAPKAQGLAVPGMVGGSPGMDSAAAEPYDVMLFQPDGGARVFSRY